MATAPRPPGTRRKGAPHGPGKVTPYRVKPRHKASGYNPKAQAEFEGTLAAERREAEARASRAQSDPAPSNRGPRAAPKGPKAPKISTKGLSKALSGFASRNPRRLLLAELLLVVVITITSRVSEGEVPRPSDLLAPFVVYLVLSFAAEVGGSTARLAAGIGGLVLLAVVMANAGGIAKTITAATMGGPTTPAAQGVSGFTEQGAGAGFGQAGGGGGSW